MKKLLLFTALVFGALVSNASYLYWQVNSADITNSSDKDFTYTSPIYAVFHDANKNGAAVDVKYYDQSSGQVKSAGSNGVLAPSDMVYAIDTSNLTENGGSYSYYIELVNSSGDFVGQQKQVTSTQASTYTDAGNTTTLFNLPTSTAIWHATGFSNAPEPTSAILMLFGAAMLGLKRKNRSQC